MASGNVFGCAVLCSWRASLLISLRVMKERHESYCTRCEYARDRMFSASWLRMLSIISLYEVSVMPELLFCCCFSKLEGALDDVSDEIVLDLWR